MVASIPYESLPLGAPWEGERPILVRITDAIRLCRDDGYQKLPFHHAVDFIERLGRRDMAAARSFVARARLYSFPLQNLDDAGLRALLRGKLRAGDLAVVREGVGGGEDAGDGEQRRLVREIEAKSQRRLGYAGRQYRLVADSRLARLADRDYYEVVSHRDAVGVLHGLAGQSGDVGLARLLTLAAGMLTQDWRPPFEPDGLVLLRRIIVKHAYKPDLGPALTPSQMKRLITKPEWIEIVVEDQDGEPYSGRYRIRLPDGVSREDSLDEAGFYGNYDLDAGNCKFELLDRTQPKPAAGDGDEELRSLPVILGDDIRLPDDAVFVLAGSGESISIPLADKFDANVGLYTFALEPLRSGVLYTGSVTFGDSSTTMFVDDDLYTRAGASVDQPLDFNLSELEHQLQAGDPAALEADPPMRDQTHADDQQASQVPENETCGLVPGEFGPHVETGEDN